MVGGRGCCGSSEVSCPLETERREVGGNEVSSENVMCLGSIEVPKKEKEKEERESCHEHGEPPQASGNLQAEWQVIPGQEPAAQSKESKVQANHLEKEGTR